MTRVSNLMLPVALTALIFFFGVSRTPAQQQTPAGQAPMQEPKAAGEAHATAPATPPAEEPAEEENHFAPEPAPVLPPGMAGSDASDPRAKLAPGLYDAGETSMGIKHLLLLKKPDAFQLGTNDPDDPKVEKTIAMLGISNTAKIPKPMHLVIAQLAFANSDFAFAGNHLFQGNFYGVNIYDIADPANTKLITSLVCPGGQGDV
jgi:hypothetical protein